MRLERAGSFVEPRLPNFPPRHHHVLAASQQSGCELHILSISEYNKLSIPLLEIFYTLVTLQLSSGIYFPRTYSSRAPHPKQHKVLNCDYCTQQQLYLPLSTHRVKSTSCYLCCCFLSFFFWCSTVLLSL